MGLVKHQYFLLFLSCIFPVLATSWSEMYQRGFALLTVTQAALDFAENGTCLDAFL